jgi:hypothetical protein
MRAAVRTRQGPAVAALLLGLVLPALDAAAGISAGVEKQLREAKYVYVSSQRKDGSFGQPAEIWFFFHQGAVYVSSPRTTWRVRRIEAGRPKAKIAVGRPGGASFAASGKLVDDPALHPVLFEAFAKKYPDGWSDFEERFRKGLKDGSRVLIRYTPD